jgi:uncharacterized protein (TIGR00369 family)
LSGESKGRGPLSAINQLIKENRISEYSSPNLALGMRPVEFGAGTSQWVWDNQPAAARNPFGTIQGGYLAIFVDELLSTAIASVLEEGEWAMTAEFKISFLRALNPGRIGGSARVLRRARTLAFLEAQITASDGAIAATASSVWAISKR